MGSRETEVGEEEQRLCRQLGTCFRMLPATQKRARMMETFLPSLFYYLFFLECVDFHHHFPDVRAQISAPGISNSLRSVVGDPIWSLTKISALESGISYPLFPFHPPCQPSPQSALGCKDLKVKADGLAKGRAKG